MSADEFNRYRTCPQEGDTNAETLIAELNAKLESYGAPSWEAYYRRYSSIDCSDATANQNPVFVIISFIDSAITEAGFRGKQYEDDEDKIFDIAYRESGMPPEGDDDMFGDLNAKMARITAPLLPKQVAEIRAMIERLTKEDCAFN